MGIEFMGDDLGGVEGIDGTMGSGYPCGGSGSSMLEDRMYKCKACGEKTFFEKIFRFNLFRECGEVREVLCPHCGNDKMKHVFSFREHADETPGIVWDLYI